MLRSCRSARRVMIPIRSRSRSRVLAGLTGSGGSSLSRRAFRNSAGSWISRPRTALHPSRQAMYSSAMSRLLSFNGAIISTSCSQSSLLARAIGTRYLPAAWGPIRPFLTCSCTDSGSSSTRARRRVTQLTHRSNWSLSSSKLLPKLRCSSDSNHPCSRADSASADRIE